MGGLGPSWDELIILRMQMNILRDKSHPAAIWKMGSVYACVGVCVCTLSCVWLFATPCTVACQAPLSMGFPDKNPGVGCHFPLHGTLLTQRSNPNLLSPVLADGFFTTEPPGKPNYTVKLTSATSSAAEPKTFCSDWGKTILYNHM